MRSLNTILRGVLVLALLLSANFAIAQQSTATLQGIVTDQTGAAVPNAQIKVTNEGTGVERNVVTNSTGNYSVPSLLPGKYRVEVNAPGLQKQVVTGLTLEVYRIVAQNFKLPLATVEETVVITGEATPIETSTMTVGQVLDPKNVQEIPLNGRHFVDLALLATGSVTPPSNGFLTAPIRGQGSLGVNTAGQRETAVNFVVNGINLTDKANGQITFQPMLSSLDEFKLDNSTFSAEEGGNAGGVVNMATRSGTNSFHGEVFDYFRNNYFDARNFFNKQGTQQSQFQRNNFGADLGGPIIKNKLFFFGSFEGLRQRQGLTINQTVLTAAQRTAALASPSTAVQKLVPIIPTSNDASGAKLVASAAAPVVLDQFAGNITWVVGEKDRINGYYVLQRDNRTEPTDAGGDNNVPGFGDQRVARRQLFTLNETHSFSSSVVNEFRLGFNRIHITFSPNNALDPTAFGIANGHGGAFGLPEIFIKDIGLDFGGVTGFPQGRGDLTSVISDTVSWQHGRHNFKFGTSLSQVNDNNFGHDQTFVQFAKVADFIADNANSYTNLGDTGNKLRARGVGLFAMDSVKLKPYFTLELGLRWDLALPISEARNRMSEFIPSTAQIVQVGTPALPRLINVDYKQFGPRVGFAWDLWHDGKTVLRAGYGIAYATSPGIALTLNPPFVTTFRFTPTGAKPFTHLESLNADAAAAGVNLGSGTIDQNFKNANVQSYNLNLQQELTPSTGLMIGYFGSKGTHLRSRINLNQPFYTSATGAQSQPFLAVSASSPIAPGLVLGKVLDDWVSNGNSNYNALWVSATRRLSHGLQFIANYTWSKSLDYSSQDTFASSDRPSNSLNVRQDYGPSDFDVRHRLTFGPVYELPFHGNHLADGWRFAGIVSLQSGSPINILAGDPAAGTGISSFTGRASIRPDVSGTIPIVNQMITTGPTAGLIQWFPSNIVCDPRGICPSTALLTIPVTVVGGNNVFHFGNMHRNALVGPDFKNVDFSLTKTTRITERLRNEFRIEVFDLLNHPNFANPGTVTSSAGRVAVNPTAASVFGVINATRFPNGDSGSSRQLQFALKFIF
jgi:hypothetical protein